MDPRATPKSPLASKTIWGAVITLLAVAAGAIWGVDLSEPDKAALTDYAVVIGGAVGGFLAIIGRYTAKRPISPAAGK